MSGSFGSKKPINKIQDSFLEALRELSGKQPKNNYPRSPMGGDFPPGGGFPPTEANPDAEAKRYKNLFFQERSLRKEEHVLRVREEQETKSKIVALREEIKKFASTQKKLQEAVKTTIIQVEAVQADSGTYYVSFLETILIWVKSMRKNAESSAHWLAAFNQKSKKKGYYWGQVKHKGGGSNFYLSGERYMSTQAG